MSRLNDAASLRRLERLCYFFERRIRAVIVGAISSDSREMRIVATKLLRVFGTNTISGIPKLIGMLKDPDPKVKLSAVNALGGLGLAAAGALTALHEALPSEKEAAVRVEIEEAIETIELALIDAAQRAPGFECTVLEPERLKPSE